MSHRVIETNIDGMIGPTHHFGGLGVGNLASQSNRHAVSYPRAAALEGLAKMEWFHQRGVPQFFLPPPLRPNWRWLTDCGLAGSQNDILKQCFDVLPSFLSAAYSASFMWMANAATVAPSCDSNDQRLHIVPANLCSSLHRGQETTERTLQLKTLFQNVPQAHIHSPLPAVLPLRDEGAANHMRLSCTESDTAIHVFVHGSDWGQSPSGRLLSRQSKTASEQLARALKLTMTDVFFAQQTNLAIDAGVFHNDVIASSHGSLLLVHESAYEGQANILSAVSDRFFQRTKKSLCIVEVTEQQLSLKEAVQTYLFNSQLIALEEDAYELLCPDECRVSESVQNLLRSWIESPTIPIQAVSYARLQQSMSNGGGPACLRLRVPLQAEELQGMSAQFRVQDESLDALRQCVKVWYPETLSFEDLARVEFADHAHRAVDAITMAMARVV